MKGHQSKSALWKGVLALSIWVIYFYVFNEWLFFLTKPSFMSSLGLFDKVLILATTPVPFLLLLLPSVLLCALPSVLLTSPVAVRRHGAIVCVLPACVLGTSCLLLLDNFTYTVMGVGIQSSSLGPRSVYIVVFAALLVFSFLFLLRMLKSILRFPALASGAFLLALISISALLLTANRGIAIGTEREQVVATGRPNILLIGGDGLEAAHTSVYGYDRDTTPFLKSLAKDALVCENAFSNAGPSGASIASMLTGKLPTRTRLIFPPDILRGRDVYQHLPAILKRYGYRSINIGIRAYADAYDMNMRNSFDVANDRSFREVEVPKSVASLIGQDSAYFLVSIFDRIWSRTLHVAGIRPITDAFAEVMDAEKSFGSDAERIKSLWSFIDSSEIPFFAHLHLLATHGPKFHSTKKKFSLGQTQNEPWMSDFYDDAILRFDRYVSRIIDQLQLRDQLESTLVIITADHGQNHTVNVRLPLILRFPRGEHAARISPNAQNLDVGATILSYLALPQPEWMEGRSLISDDLRPDFPIFSADRRHGVTRLRAGWIEMNVEEIGPPFYSLGYLGVLICDQFFQLEIEPGILRVSKVNTETSSCSHEELPATDEISQMLVNHLRESGYDTSSIKIPFTEIHH